MSYEYAKFVKVLATGTSNRGFQAKLTLPSSTTMLGGSNYINFYCGVAGWECGISKPAGQTNWHWFVNNANGETNPASQPFNYPNGSQVTIKLYLDDTTNKARFDVNGVNVFESQNTYSGSNDARLIFGACQTTYTTLPPTLPAWQISHTQVKAENMMFKNSSKTWVAVTGTNAAASAFHTPSMTTPAPVDYTYTATLGSALITASI